MKKKKTIEIRCCDWCGEENVYYKCEACQRDACYECKSTVLKTLHSTIYCDSSDDLTFCLDCYKNRDFSNPNLVLALEELNLLREAHLLYSKDFDKKRKALEEKVEKLRV